MKQENSRKRELFVKERVLREDVLGRIGRLNDEGKKSLAGIIQDFRSVPTETLIGFIVETVRNAEVGIWKGGGISGGPIGVG
ncbi:MAG TPA: hypothetical protein VF828_04165, partial [Patescibacteria group bacterium]